MAQSGGGSKEKSEKLSMKMAMTNKKNVAYR